MSRYTYSKDWTIDEILEKSQELEGLALRDIDQKGWLKNTSNKGAIGNMIQEDFFGIPANSDREADFNFHGIELKVTPIKRKKGEGFSSKERLVLGMINYMNDYTIPYEESLPNKKTKNTLLIFYLYEENTPAEQFIILKSMMFQLPAEDIPQVKADYNTIIEKIKAGKAHEISEKQQIYLGACTKGQGRGRDFVNQPFSEIKAKSRAYSYKVGYMSAYFRKLMTPSEIEHILIPRKQSFLEMVEETFTKYINRTDEEIRKNIEYTKSINAKDYLASLTNCLFGDHTNSKVNQTQEFMKEGYALKTITKRLDKNKNQDMAFPNIDFFEIQYDTFEESSWYGRFAETKYIVAVWKEVEEKKYVLEQFTYWIPTERFINQAENIYNHIKMMLENDILVVFNQGQTKHQTWKDNLPKKGEYAPFQVRPKGSGESVIFTLPNGKMFKKKCFMIDKEYIWAQLNIRY